MNKITSKLFYVLFSLFILYCFVWYGWGIYVKSSIHKNIADLGIKLDKVELSGFPFKLQYNLRNLKMDYRRDGESRHVEFGNVILESSLLLRRFTAIFDNNINITSEDKKINYTIDHAKNSSLKVKLNNLHGFYLLRGKEAAKLSWGDIEYIHYCDSGSVLKDNILDKPISPLREISIIDEIIAPDCEMKETGPAAGISVAKVALIPLSVLIMPRQLGPSKAILASWHI